MPEETPVQREAYAIPDDDIDLRLIQRQIANAIAASRNGGKAPSSIGKPELNPIERGDNPGEESSSKDTPGAEEKSAETPVVADIKVAKKASLNSTEDSMDINELVNDSVADISLDLLEQLTSKINSEMAGNSPTDVIISTPSVEVDEIEENINNIESEEALEVEAINKENERTVVTEQISEYPINQADVEYIQSLDYLDGDKKYKKYVIYIDDVNVDFIDSLSIADRKQIINSILREQDDIRIARREEEHLRKLVTHILIGVITFFVVIPLMYLLVNTCLEATIDNYRRSQNNFEVLYKERGKIKSTHH